MQKIQYHGIESYKFEYQLSTEGDWQTALNTTASTATTYDYTYEELIGEKSYNLKVTVIDQAGNTSTGTNTANTKKPEKNPGGVITDITSTEIINPGANSSLIHDNTCRICDYTFEEKTVTFSSELSGGSTSYTSKNGTPWYVFAEDSENIFLIIQGERITLGRSRRV